MSLSPLPNELLSALGFDDPDNVGSSEYRAIYELLDDALAGIDSDEDEVDVIESMLEEFHCDAMSMLKSLRKNRKHLTECAECHRPVNAKAAHKHRKVHLCGNCWDERLRTTA